MEQELLLESVQDLPVEGTRELRSDLCLPPLGHGIERCPNQSPLALVEKSPQDCDRSLLVLCSLLRHASAAENEQFVQRETGRVGYRHRNLVELDSDRVPGEKTQKSQCLSVQAQRG